MPGGEAEVRRWELGLFSRGDQLDLFGGRPPDLSRLPGVEDAVLDMLVTFEPDVRRRRCLRSAVDSAPPSGPRGICRPHARFDRTGCGRAQRFPPPLVDQGGGEQLQAVRIHHLNCVSECPLGGAFVDGRTFGLRAWLPVHCLAVESPAGLILVDTGFGLGDVRDPMRRLGKHFLFTSSPDLREAMTAVRQLAVLGYEPEDVRHIVLTHLDLDHAGGIEDFPEAKVHLLLGEQEAALAPRTVLDRMRYRPERWGHTPARWHVYTPGEGETWFGFSAVRALEGLDDEIALVPLVGHTLGHAGVAVHEDGRWLLLAGDAYFWHGEMDLRRPRCPPGLLLYQLLTQKDGAARRWNQRRLRALKSQHRAEVRLVCSHDPLEFEAMAGRGLEEPIPAPERLLTEPPRDESVLF